MAGGSGVQCNAHSKCLKHMYAFNFVASGTVYKRHTYLNVNQSSKPKSCLFGSLLLAGYTAENMFTRRGSLKVKRLMKMIRLQ